MGWSFVNNTYRDQDDFVQSILAGLPGRFAPGTELRVVQHHALRGVLFLGLLVNGQKRLYVVLIRKERGQWGENFMNIEEIPSDFRCPEKLLQWYLMDNLDVSGNAQEYIAACRAMRLRAANKRAEVRVIRSLPIGGKVMMPGYPQVFEIRKHNDFGMPRGQCQIQDVESGKLWLAAYRDLVRYDPNPGVV